MKLLWLIAFFIHQASFSNDVTCRKSLSLLSGWQEEKIIELYDFKNNNHGNWVLAGEHSQIHFILEPQKITTYHLRWKIKQYGRKGDNFQDGELSCGIPQTWQLKPEKSLQIIFPKAAHGQVEDSLLHSLTTFAGIYLGKSKYSLQPDVVNIFWHLEQTRSSHEFQKKVIAPYSFIGPHNLTFLNDTLDKNSDVQLVGLHFSQTMELDQGEQYWLVTDAKDQDAIRKSLYQTSESKHNMWLPWLDSTRPEFATLTPLELYKTTVLAGLDQAKIYNRRTHAYVSERMMSVPDKMQMVYDIIAPLVWARIEDNKALFVHLLLQSKTGYELFSFEILQSGALLPLSNQELKDPSLIGLPSAQELGFDPQSPSDMDLIPSKVNS